MKSRTDRATADFLSLINQTWHHKTPLLRLFSTEKNKYVYDTGTNRILRLDSNEFLLLSYLVNSGDQSQLDLAGLNLSEKAILKATSSIKKAILSLKVFSLTKARDFGLTNYFSKLPDLVSTSLGMMELEVSERCNLRCGYCVYNSFFSQKRDHGIRDMSFETARHAIDLLARNSRNKEEVVLSFYGGEPLINFPLISACVEYARPIFSNKKLKYSLTTNATLIGKEIAKFLANEQFSVVASIDGPKDIHDSYRLDCSGSGSFDRAIRGLKLVADAYGDRYDNIMLNIVYAPPYSSKKIARICEMWEEFEWLPKNIVTNISYPLGFPEKIESGDKEEKPHLEKTLFDWASRQYKLAYSNGDRSFPISTYVLEKKLAALFKRPIYKTNLDRFYLNGCCIPGVRKLFVSVDGVLSLCERILSAPTFGDVVKGIDNDRLYETYIASYSAKSFPTCSLCWSLRICDLCYMHAYKDDQFDSKMKETNCDTVRSMNEEYLRLYCELIELNSDGLDYLANYEIR